MALSEWGTSPTDTTPILITNVKLNSNGYDFFKGTAGYEDSLQLGYYSGNVLTFAPNSGPTASQAAIFIQDNNGVGFGNWLWNGVMNIHATVAGALTIQPVSDPAGVTQLFQYRGASGTIRFAIDCQGDFFAIGTASLGGLTVASTVVANEIDVTSLFSTGGFSATGGIRANSTASIDTLVVTTSLLSAGNGSMGGVVNFQNVVIQGVASIANIAGSTGTAFSNILVSGTASINALDTVTLIGPAASIARLNVTGGSNTTASLSSVPSQGTLFVQDAGIGNSDAGGVIAFGMGQNTFFGAIKALGFNGSGNTSGDIAIAVRQQAADTALSEVLRVSHRGYAQVTGGLITTGTATLSTVHVIPTNAAQGQTMPVLLGTASTGTAVATLGIVGPVAGSLPTDYRSLRVLYSLNNDQPSTASDLLMTLEVAQLAKFANGWQMLLGGAVTPTSMATGSHAVLGALGASGDEGPTVGEVIINSPGPNTAFTGLWHSARTASLTASGIFDYHGSFATSQNFGGVMFQTANGATNLSGHFEVWGYP